MAKAKINYAQMALDLLDGKVSQINRIELEKIFSVIGFKDVTRRMAKAEGRGRDSKTISYQPNQQDWIDPDNQYPILSILNKTPSFYGHELGAIKDYIGELCGKTPEFLQRVEQKAQAFNSEEPNYAEAVTARENTSGVVLE